MQKIQPDAASQAFLNGINEGVAAMKAPIPGWNDATCSMDWKEWACFCNNAATLNWTKDFLSGFSKLSYECDPAVKSDPAYACVEPPCGSEAPAKGFFSGWFPWAIGGVAAVGIGTMAVLMSTGKIGKSNPTEGAGMFKAVMFDKNGKQQVKYLPTADAARSYVGPVARRGGAVEIWDPNGRLIHLWYPTGHKRGEPRFLKANPGYDENPSVSLPKDRKLIKIIFWNNNAAVFAVPENTRPLKPREVMHTIPKSWEHIASTALQPDGRRVWFMNEDGMFKKAPVDMRKLFNGLPLYGEHSPSKN
jgi:hypothetical protein